ncbi:hypothetical protein MJO28_005843 [Puccinia striiformis f. sp. tritici]|uniref:Uncharacterized protein n=3 Tax=Puccinia striiformis TaxID=27350 RepID=A0A0L0V599_9BASI|nr:hypothetical protein Pst134EA_011058 [Puccinia striiformis f. sp. tritici]KNE94376.1 hypothetical protein PSTG_12276 [Puccinia striiformis f. sp. tritici PST-78]KAH9455809.1 hypothetical protein Pst134EB_012045 [Puccinia striiformis f. sp. tritici]KAH9467412.1 hypothetical protein Pst134EA_011058 [Puccinia striiformis f. sp. tritici]KAI7953296.1 hypothetical protein MJO28_005843 [Puccinia striiformis f. sp. tritici]KAI7957642.1 hypothetical protein MJO29_005859 [Puccinia striiformis f. sp. 
MNHHDLNLQPIIQRTNQSATTRMIQLPPIATFINSNNINTPIDESDHQLYAAQAIQGLRRLRDEMDLISTNLLSNNTRSPPPRHQQDLTSLIPQPDPPIEFREHAQRRRSNQRPLTSQADNNTTIEASGRLDSRKRKYDSSKGLSDSFGKQSQARDINEPTTAELAEAAARESNVHNSLPAFYSPDNEESLKVETIIIPVDTNPMERRKIIIDSSKDGSIRWKDNQQKTIYDRSKDGLVGEEIGEISFDYLILPKKPLPKPATNPQQQSCPRHSNHNNNLRDSSTQHTGAASQETDRSRTMREALESFHDSRQHDPYSRPFDLSSPLHRMNDRYGVRLFLGRTNRHSTIRGDSPYNETNTPAPTLPTENNRQPSTTTTTTNNATTTTTSTTTTAVGATRAPRLSRSTSTSTGAGTTTGSGVGRLTRRPIRWFERPSARDLSGPSSRISSFLSNHPDASLLDHHHHHPHIYSSSYHQYRNHLHDLNSHPSIPRAERIALDVESLYNDLDYNRSLHHPLDQFLFSSSSDSPDSSDTTTSASASATTHPSVHRSGL